jgi:hypothetical protein
VLRGQAIGDFSRALIVVAKAPSRPFNQAVHEKGPILAFPLVQRRDSVHEQLLQRSRGEVVELLHQLGLDFRRLRLRRKRAFARKV